MFTIRPLLEFDPIQLAALIAPGYTSAEKYAVERAESDESAAIRLRLVQLERPYRKVFEVTPEDLARYRQLAPLGFSFGAYAGRAEWMGVLLASPQEWNRSLWVLEFHVAPKWQGQGAGRALMQAAAEKARSAGLRTLVCETQTTNVPAMRAYRKLGFTLQGVDLSYYSNEDYPEGEIAVFMKREI
jgi:streptothricin acetyltransferase